MKLDRHVCFWKKRFFHAKKIDFRSIFYGFSIGWKNVFRINGTHVTSTPLGICSENFFSTCLFTIAGLWRRMRIHQKMSYLVTTRAFSRIFKFLQNLSMNVSFSIDTHVFLAHYGPFIEYYLLLVYKFNCAVLSEGFKILFSASEWYRSEIVAMGGGSKKGLGWFLLICCEKGEIRG